MNISDVNNSEDFMVYVLTHGFDFPSYVELKEGILWMWRTGSADVAKISLYKKGTRCRTLFEIHEDIFHSGEHVSVSRGFMCTISDRAVIREIIQAERSKEQEVG